MSFETVTYTEDEPTRKAREKCMARMQNFKFGKASKEWAHIAYARHQSKEIRFPPAILDIIKRALLLDGKDVRAEALADGA